MNFVVRGLPGLVFAVLLAAAPTGLAQLPVGPLDLHSHAGIGLPELTSGEIPSLRASEPRVYRGSGLYGYIDGGADLYKEYGFVRLGVQRVIMKQHSGGVGADTSEFTVETYEMSDPTAAFGIFSIARAGGIGDDGLGMYSCVSANLCMFAFDNWYVRVLNFSGSEAERTAGILIAQEMREKIRGRSVEIPGPILRTGAWLGFLQCVRGLLGIQNSKPEWEEYFEGVKRFDLWFIPLRRDQEMTFALAVFSTPADCDTVLRRLDQDRNVRARRRDEHSLVWLSDIPSQFSTQSLDSLLVGSPPSH